VNQRTVIIALILVCLMGMIGLVELRGWEGSEEKTERPSKPPGCFDIKANSVTARHTFLVNKCTGETWNAVREGLDGPLVWERMRKY